MNKILIYPKKNTKQNITPEIVAEIKTLLNAGIFQHEIAARYGINQGRISEINTGIKYPNIAPAQLELVFQ